MSLQRILGIVLLVGGIGLFIVGMYASQPHSAPDQMSNTFTGTFPDKPAAARYIYGGMAAGVAGLLLVIFRVRGDRA